MSKFIIENKKSLANTIIDEMVKPEGRRSVFDFNGSEPSFDTGYLYKFPSASMIIDATQHRGFMLMYMVQFLHTMEASVGPNSYVGLAFFERDPYRIEVFHMRWTRHRLEAKAGAINNRSNHYINCSEQKVVKVL